MDLRKLLLTALALGCLLVAGCLFAILGFLCTGYCMKVLEDPNNPVIRRMFHTG